MLSATRVVARHVRVVARRGFAGGRVTLTDEARFHQVADETLEMLLNAAIDLEEKRDLEAELAAGVLKITLEDTGQSWVVNKQTPNKQIWLSSPLSGPCRFELEDGVWRHTRDGSELFKTLHEELDLEIEEGDLP